MRLQQACLPPVCQVQTCVQEYRELLHALRTIAFVCSFGLERLRCSGANRHHLCDTGNYHHLYDAGYPHDRHERAAWLSTGLRGTPTHHYGNSYPLVAVRLRRWRSTFHFYRASCSTWGKRPLAWTPCCSLGTLMRRKNDEHERWWAEIAERSVSNDRPAVDD